MQQAGGPISKGGWSVVSENPSAADDDDMTDLFETRESFLKKDEWKEYVDHGSFDKASLDTPLPDDNRGMKLLYKMGWKKDTSLGRDGTGIIKPIQLVDASLGYGLGKQEEYDQNADEATRNRRLLDIEVEETAELKQHRMEKAAREETLKQEIKDMNKGFHCELCDKQYKTVGEMSNHLSSYDHHHTKRLKEAKDAERARKSAKAGTRAKQDQAIVDREMQRRVEAAQAAAANRQPPPPSAAPPPPPLPPPPPPFQHPPPAHSAPAYPAPPPPSHALYPPQAPHHPHPPPPHHPYSGHYGVPPQQHGYAPHHHQAYPPHPHHQHVAPPPSQPYGYAAQPPPPPPSSAPPPPPPPPPPEPSSSAAVPEVRGKISISIGLKAKLQKKPIR